LAREHARENDKGQDDTEGDLRSDQERVDGLAPGGERDGKGGDQSDQPGNDAADPRPGAPVQHALSDDLTAQGDRDRGGLAGAEQAQSEEKGGRVADPLADEGVGGEEVAGGEKGIAVRVVETGRGNNQDGGAVPR
jgi:hypothetical protein